MAAECSIQMLEYESRRKNTFSSHDIVVEELRGLLEGHTCTRVPYRSGSAPPNMQGSFTAVENIKFQKKISLPSVSVGSIRKDESVRRLLDDRSTSSSNKSFTFPPPLAPQICHRQRDSGSGGEGNLLMFSAISSGCFKQQREFLSSHKGDGIYERNPHQLDERRHETPSQNDLFHPSSSLHTQFLPARSGSSEDFTATASHFPHISPPDTQNMSGNLSLHKEEDLNIVNRAENGHLNCPKTLDAIGIESRMATISISAATTYSATLKHREELFNFQPNQSLHEEWGGDQTQHASLQLMSTEGDHTLSVDADRFVTGPSKLPSSSLQPVLQSSGFTPPLYATVASFVTSANSLYPMQSPGLVSAPYSLGGYALNSRAMPPFYSLPPVCGYSCDTSFVQGVDVQHMNKLYGHYGLFMQPFFDDSLYIQYYRQPYVESSSFIRQHYLSPSHGGYIGGQDDSSELQKAYKYVAISNEQNFQNQREGFVLNMNPRTGKGTISDNPGVASGMGVMLQYPFSHQLTPTWHDSSAGNGFVGSTNETHFCPSPNGNLNMYSSWRSPKSCGSYIGKKMYSCLEELKSRKGRILEVSEIVGNVVELSADQYGSRLIQQKLETCSSEEMLSIFKEVLPHASRLMTDVFGNYVIQKFFEYGSSEQRKELADELRGRVLRLSLQTYGCRVIQKVLEVIDLEQRLQLVCELDGYVLQCILDQNGNHVIQKCIECIPVDQISFIISSFHGQVATLSMHPYGCRVIQRVLEHSSEGLSCQFLVDEILKSIDSLAHDQYGNYVTQHVLVRGQAAERSEIISRLSGHLVKMSQHKFASNVVEKCVECANRTEKELLFQEITGIADGNDNLLMMMKDQFANYVVQKVLETCSEKQRELLLDRIKVHIHALRKYTYGKHIVARFEQIIGEASHTSS